MWREFASAPMDDQASGLRRRVWERSEASSKGVVAMPSEKGAIPLVKTHLRIGGGAISIPSGSLVWHWRRVPRTASGWDLQARLHVCGLPHQFSTVQLSQWRYLCPEWHLLGNTPELLMLTDVAVLWLPADGNPASLLPLLRRWHAWLCRICPERPIILTGVPPTIGRRLMHWAGNHVRWLLDEDALGAVPQPSGYYRLLARCRDHPAQLSRPTPTNGGTQR